MRAAGAGSLRLRLLGWIFVGINVLIAARLVQIQIFRHDYYLERAEGQWRHRISLPARRGDIYDRHGRPLALSTTTWRVGVAGSLADDPGEVSRRLAAAIPDQVPDAAVLEAKIASAGRRHVVVARSAALDLEDIAALKCEPSVTMQRMGSRTYPLGGTGMSVIGFHREDSGGAVLATGLERGLDGWLAGEAGEAWQYDTALPGRTLGTEVLRRPRDGRDVVLTLDADLQAICEDLLQQAVERCSAGAGAVLIVDPADGSVLAAADWPVMRERSGEAADPGAWDNFNFTGMYEPGSVMKIFTAASLLRRGAITTETEFDCADNDFGSFRLHDSEGHDFGVIGFVEAFVHSSNVYFGRAATNLRKRELYRDLREFGFGTRTRFPYPGLTAGLVREPQDWSGRSLPTIAIGQEIGVSPLQLAMAAAAVANGGRLYAPRIVERIEAGPDRPPVEGPVVMRGEVVSPDLAALLRELMAQVVEQGTGVEAAVPWTRVAGKTGTAQKAAGGRGYAPGKYMSSFLAMVPAENPRLVILTMLDEPDYAHHYASLSAAPLCGRIVTEIARCTGWFDGIRGLSRVAARPAEDGDLRPVPDVLFIPAAAARERLRRAGLEPAGDAASGLVVAQIPAAGSAAAPGETVALTVAAGTGRAAAGIICPDLAGLSNREVLRRAARLGVEVAIEGAGYVCDQFPSPGSVIGPEGLKVRMAAKWR